MVKRVIILAVLILLHIVTPRWALSDLLVIADWVMIFLALIALIIYKFHNGLRSISILSFSISLNSLIFFITTVQVKPAHIINERALYRLSIIFSLNIDAFIDIQTSKMIETLNILQVGLNVLIVMMLTFVYIKNRLIVNR
jgi:hypothetical protein